MLTQTKLNELGNYYLEDLKRRGREFNKIIFILKTRKSAQNFGKAILSNERLGYDQIEINQYLTDQNELINTILHELAHLDLYARGYGHGPRWKRIANTYGHWYNTLITTTSHKEVSIPGMVEIHVEWSDKCLQINKHLDRKYVKRVTSEKRAETFIKKYSNIGFINSYKVIKTA